MFVSFFEISVIVNLLFFLYVISFQHVLVDNFISLDSFQRGSQETSISGSQFSEPGTSENDSMKGAQSDSSVSFAEAQRLISLFFALCIKV